MSTTYLPHKTLYIKLIFWQWQQHLNILIQKFKIYKSWEAFHFYPSTWRASSVRYTFPPITIICVNPILRWRYSCRQQKYLRLLLFALIQDNFTLKNVFDLMCFSILFECVGAWVVCFHSHNTAPWGSVVYFDQQTGAPHPVRWSK